MVVRNCWRERNIAEFERSRAEEAIRRAARERRIHEQEMGQQRSNYQALLKSAAVSAAERSAAAFYFAGTAVALFCLSN